MFFGGCFWNTVNTLRLFCVTRIFLLIYLGVQCYWIDLCGSLIWALLKNYPLSSSNEMNSSISDLKSVFFVLFDSWSL